MLTAMNDLTRSRDGREEEKEGNATTFAASRSSRETLLPPRTERLTRSREGREEEKEGDATSFAASRSSREITWGAGGDERSHAKRAMSLRLIDEHENRRWPARIGNSRLFGRALSIP
jgi:hypothetical protein